MGDCLKAVWIILLAYSMMGIELSSGACFDMTPKNDIFLLSGTDLNINCTLKVSNTNTNHCYSIMSDFDVYKIRIMKGSMELPSNLFAYHEAEDTLTMTVPNVTFEDGGDYLCTYGDNTTVIYAIKNVHVGEPPGAPENLQCISKNFEDLQCSFSLSKKPVNIPMNWTMEFTISPSERYKVSCLSSSDFSFSCICPENLFYQYEKYQLFIDGSNKDFRIHENKSFHIVLNESIVQTNPVLQLKYKYTNIRSQVVINWNGPDLHYRGNLPFPLDYKIVIISDWERRIEWINNTKDGSGQYDLKSHKEYNLTGLIPYANYSVTVQAKPTDAHGNIYWSNASVEKFYTLSEVSEHAVQVTAGSYMVLDCGELMCPILYWKNPERKYWYGSFVGYRIVIWKVVGPDKSTMATNGHIDKRNIDTEPVYERVIRPLYENITGMSVSGTLRTQMSKKESYQVQIMLVNSEGVSKSNSEILISNWKTDQMLKPELVSVEMDKSMLYISWDMDPADCEDVTSVTYYWCLMDTESPFNSSYVNCKEDFDWYTVNITDGCGNENRHIIEKPSNELRMRYAVSLKTSPISGGMTWENFRFNKNNAPETPLYRVVILDGTTMEVHIQYKDYHVSEGGRPTNYSVKYKECDGSSDCVSDTKVETFYANLSIPVYKIRNLKAGATYQVSVKSENSFGSSEYGAFTKISLPKDESSYIWIIVLGSVAGLIVLILLIFFCKRRLRKYELENKVRIPGQNGTYTERSLNVEMDLEKADVTKSPDDHDSGKGSDSPGSSVVQEDQQEEKDGGSSNGIYPGNERSQSSPTLSGYLKVGKGSSSNFSYKFENSDDETDSFIEEASSERKERKQGSYHDIDDNPSDSSVKEINSIEVSNMKMDSSVTNNGWNSVPEKSSEAVTTLVDVKRLTSELKSEKPNIDLGFDASKCKNDMLCKREYLPNDSTEYSRAVMSLEKDKTERSNYEKVLGKLENEDGHFPDSSSNGMDTANTPKNSDETGANFDSSSSFKDEIPFENIIGNSEITNYRNPDDVSLDGSVFSEESDEERDGSVFSEESDEERFSSEEYGNMKTSENHNVPLTKLPSLDTRQEVNDTKADHFDNKTFQETEQCNFPKNSALQDCRDKVNVTFDSTDMKKLNDSGQDEISSEESKSICGTASLESYMKTCLGNIPNGLLEYGKVDEGKNREISKKDAFAKMSGGVKGLINDE